MPTCALLNLAVLRHRLLYVSLTESPNTNPALGHEQTSSLVRDDQTDGYDKAQLAIMTCDWLDSASNQPLRCSSLATATNLYDVLR